MPGKGPPRRPTRERFAAKIIKTDSCWLWTDRSGQPKPKVHGQIWDDQRERMVPVHRYAYELVNGPLDPIYVVDHTCENKGCVRVEHLEAVTAAVNTARIFKRRAAFGALLKHLKEDHYGCASCTKARKTFTEREYGEAVVA